MLTFFPRLIKLPKSSCWDGAFIRPRNEKETKTSFRSMANSFKVSEGCLQMPVPADFIMWMQEFMPVF